MEAGNKSNQVFVSGLSHLTSNTANGGHAGISSRVYEEKTLELVEKLLAEGEEDEALALLSDIIPYIETSISLLLKLAHIQRLCGKDNEAAETLIKIISKNGHNVQAYIELAGLFQAHKQTDEALKVLDMYPMTASKVVPGLHRTRSLIYASQGDFAKAADSLAKALIDGEETAEDLILTGSYYAVQNEGEKHEQSLRRALKLHPGNVQATRQIVSLLISKNTKESVREALDMFMDIFGDAKQQLAEVVIEMMNGLLSVAEEKLTFADITKSATRALRLKDKETTISQPSMRAAKNSHPSGQLARDVQTLVEDPISTSHYEKSNGLRGQIVTIPYVPENKRQVILVCDEFRVRAGKIARLLRQSGWGVTLLAQQMPPAAFTENFDDIGIYRTESDLIKLGNHYKNKVFHLFSGNANKAITELMGVKPGKMIYDPYDFIDGLIKAHYTYKIGQMQRYCLERADGICARDLRIRYLKKALGFRIPSRVVYFSDYCSLEDLNGNSKPKISSNEVHVALCGSISTNRTKHENDWGLAEVCRLLGLGRVHTHVYPHPRQFNSEDFHEEFAEFYNLASEIPYIHMHAPVPMSQLREELSQYHIGLNATYACIPDRSLWCYTDAHFKYCSSTRNLEYLEAGLPLLVNGGLQKFQYRNFRRHGIALNLDEELLKDPAPKISQFVFESDLSQKITNAQRSLSVEKQIPRLINFYSQFL